MQPPLQTFAENILAEGSRIDLVTRDPLGAVVIVLVADRGQDLAGFTRAQAHVSWVRQRIPDWRQLGPGLVLSGEVHALLLSPDFQPETIAAARSGDSPVKLARYRDPQAPSFGDLVEPLAQPQHDEAALERAATAEPAPSSATPQSGAWAGREPLLPPHGEFRSGLSELDLQITPEERGEFS